VGRNRHRARCDRLERGQQQWIVEMSRFRRLVRQQCRVGPAELHQRLSLHSPDRPAVVVVQRLRSEGRPGTDEQRGERGNSHPARRCTDAGSQPHTTGKRDREHSEDCERGPAGRHVDERKVGRDDPDDGEAEQVRGAERRPQERRHTDTDDELERVRQQQAHGHRGLPRTKTTSADALEEAGRFGSSQ
jgi:hypothetical protein